MRFSIVFDDNETLLAPTTDAERAGKPAFGPGENSGRQRPQESARLMGKLISQVNGEQHAHKTTQ